MNIAANKEYHKSFSLPVSFGLFISFSAYAPFGFSF